MVGSAVVQHDSVDMAMDPTYDRDFMEAALAAARRGDQAGEVPVGAVVVRHGRIIAQAFNAPIALNDPSGHAEVLALREAARHEKNYRLSGTTMYVSLEPCVMCVGALLLARVDRVVFACADPKAGALGSVYDIGRDGRSNHRLAVTSGIAADQASALLRQFFCMRRGA